MIRTRITDAEDPVTLSNTATFGQSVIPVKGKVSVSVRLPADSVDNSQWGGGGDEGA